jgi:hypothetical protein
MVGSPIVTADLHDEQKLSKVSMAGVEVGKENGYFS